MALEAAAVASITKEISSVDKVVSNLVNFDYIVKDATAARSLKTIIDRLEWIYFSRSGSLGLLEKLSKREHVTMDMFRDATQEFYDEQDEASRAIETIQKLVGRHEIKFEEDFLPIIELLLDLKSKVRDRIRDLLRDLEDSKFSPDALDRAASTATTLINCIRPLNGSIRMARSKISEIQQKK